MVVGCCEMFLPVGVHDVWRIRGYSEWASYQALPRSLGAQMIIQR